MGQLHGSSWGQTVPLATGSQQGSGPLRGDKWPLCTPHSGFRGQEELSEAPCEHSIRGGSSYKIINNIVRGVGRGAVVQTPPGGSHRAPASLGAATAKCRPGGPAPAAFQIRSGCNPPSALSPLRVPGLQPVSSCFLTCLAQLSERLRSERALERTPRGSEVTGSLLGAFLNQWGRLTSSRSHLAWPGLGRFLGTIANIRQGEFLPRATMRGLLRLYRTMQ